MTHDKQETFPEFQGGFTRRKKNFPPRHSRRCFAHTAESLSFCRFCRFVRVTHRTGPRGKFLAREIPPEGFSGFRRPLLPLSAGGWKFPSGEPVFLNINFCIGLLRPQNRLPQQFPDFDWKRNFPPREIYSSLGCRDPGKLQNSGIDQVPAAMRFSGGGGVVSQDVTKSTPRTGPLKHTEGQYPMYTISAPHQRLVVIRPIAYVKRSLRQQYDTS